MSETAVKVQDYSDPDHIHIDVQPVNQVPLLAPNVTGQSKLIREILNSKTNYTPGRSTEADSYSASQRYEVIGMKK